MGQGADEVLRGALAEIGPFSRGLMGGRVLRPYQREVAEAIIASVRRGDGQQFAVVFARQAGKDETIAQTLAYLLATHWRRGGSIVVAAPTFRPQSLVSRARLLERLDNDLTRRLTPPPKTESGYIVRLGRATARFLSAGPGANVRGETASLLLVCNEAQDVDPDRWDAVFDPMAAATNATTVFSGTVWSDKTLLARQMRHLRALERADSRKRVFLVPWRGSRLICRPTASGCGRESRSSGATTRSSAPNTSCKSWPARAASSARRGARSSRAITRASGGRHLAAPTPC